MFKYSAQCLFDVVSLHRLEPGPLPSPQLCMQTMAASGSVENRRNQQLLQGLHQGNASFRASGMHRVQWQCFGVRLLINILKPPPSRIMETGPGIHAYILGGAFSATYTEPGHVHCR